MKEGKYPLRKKSVHNIKMQSEETDVLSYINFSISSLNLMIKFTITSKILTKAKATLGRGALIHPMRPNALG